MTCLLFDFERTAIVADVKRMWNGCPLDVRDLAGTRGARHWCHGAAQRHAVGTLGCTCSPCLGMYCLLLPRSERKCGLGRARSPELAGPPEAAQDAALLPQPRLSCLLDVQSLCTDGRHFVLDSGLTAHLQTERPADWRCGGASRGAAPADRALAAPQAAVKAAASPTRSARTHADGMQ